MTDIVERLRKGCGSDIPFWIYRERREAADEIERLRKINIDRGELCPFHCECHKAADEIERLHAKLKACHESLVKSGISPPPTAMTTMQHIAKDIREGRFPQKS